MSIYSLTGKDTIAIDLIPLNDFCDGDIATLELPNTLVETTTGKDGNTIFAYNASGKNATLTLRVLLSSSDDKRLNGMIPKEKDFPSYVLHEASIIKQVGDGSGNISYNTYLLSGGMVQKMPAMKSNSSGDTEQSIVEYTIIFANADRAIA